MSTIQNIDQLYGRDPSQGWVFVQLDKIISKDQGIEIASQVTSDAHMERLKAATKVVIAGGMGLFFAACSLIAFKVGALFVGVLAIPTAIIPPLHRLVTYLGGLGVGAGFLYFTFRNHSQFYLNEAYEHWNYADHLYSQAHAARLHAHALQSKAIVV